MNVLRILKFATKISVNDAKSLCNGAPLFPVFRQGQRAWKKAIHSLLDRLPGHHVVWWSLEQKEKEVKGSSSAAWTAEEEELREGVKFVNNYAPDDDSANQQYLWILTKIRPDSGVGHCRLAGRLSHPDGTEQNQRHGGSNAVDLFPLHSSESQSRSWESSW